MSPIDDSAFFLYIREQAAKLKNPSVEDMKSYLISMDDGFRSEVMAAYLKTAASSPKLYDLFLSYYTITDYGAGAYDADTLKRVCSGRSAEQTDQLMRDLAEYPDVLTIYRGEAEGSLIFLGISPNLYGRTGKSHRGERQHLSTRESASLAGRSDICLSSACPFG